MSKCKNLQACPHCNYFQQGFFHPLKVVRSDNSYFMRLTKPDAKGLMCVGELLLGKLYITQRTVPHYAKDTTLKPGTDIQKLVLQDGYMFKPEATLKDDPPKKCWYCGNVDGIGFSYNNLGCKKCLGYVCWCCAACWCDCDPRQGIPKLEAFPIPPHIRYLYTRIYRGFRKD